MLQLWQGRPSQAGLLGSRRQKGGARPETEREAESERDCCGCQGKGGRKGGRSMVGNDR